jgi:hypothetical protein
MREDPVRQAPLAMDAAAFRAIGHRLVDQLANSLDALCPSRCPLFAQGLHRQFPHDARRRGGDRRHRRSTGARGERRTRRCWRCTLFAGVTANRPAQCSVSICDLEHAGFSRGGSGLRRPPAADRG